MKLYPLMMRLEGRRVLVVGGGAVAFRKTVSLLEGGAEVTLVSPEAVDELADMAAQGRIRWIAEPFSDRHLDVLPDTTLVFGATSRRDVNVAIHKAATDRKIPCNIADVPDLCTFFVPAVITQGELMIAVSTGGSSPALARRIREDLERRFGPEYAEMVRVMGELRKLVLQTGNSSDENKKVFRQIVDSDLLEALRDHDTQRVSSIIRDALPADTDARSVLNTITRI